MEVFHKIVWGNQCIYGDIDQLVWGKQDLVRKIDVGLYRNICGANGSEVSY